MLTLKKYNCPECEKELKFDLKEFERNPKAPMPFVCQYCIKTFGWPSGAQQEAHDYLKQRLNLQLYKEEDWCVDCQATGNLKSFTNDFEECKICEGFGVINEALKEEKNKEKAKNNKKGVKLGAGISKEMKRLKATGLSIKDGKIIYKIPKEVKEKKRKEFEKNKKKKKLAKKSRKK